MSGPFSLHKEGDDVYVLVIDTGWLDHAEPLRVYSHDHPFLTNHIGVDRPVVRVLMTAAEAATLRLAVKEERTL